MLEELTGRCHPFIRGCCSSKTEAVVDTPNPNHVLRPDREGRKLDQGKPPVYQGVIKYFPRALMEVAKVSAKGAEKYDWHNWKLVDNKETRYRDAMMRHLIEEQITELDEETELMHLAHAVWNGLAVLEMMLESNDSDSQ